MKKHLLVAATAVTIGLGAAIPAAVTVSSLAESDTSTKSSIVDTLATKFNLKKEDVQKVFEEEHTARHAEREQAYKDTLAQAVKDGKLTQAQADKVQAKHDELKAEMEKNRDAMKDKTREERKAEMDKKREELKKWASDNGIDESYLMPGHGGRGHGPDGRH